MAFVALRLLLVADDQLVVAALLALHRVAGPAGVLALGRPLAALRLAAVVETGFLLLGECRHGRHRQHEHDSPEPPDDPSHPVLLPGCIRTDHRIAARSRHSSPCSWRWCRSCQCGWRCTPGSWR